MNLLTHFLPVTNAGKSWKKKTASKKDVNEERDRCNSLVGEVRQGDKIWDHFSLV